jgi:hypothetical protein
VPETNLVPTPSASASGRDQNESGAPAGPTLASASCISPPGKDSAGNASTYDPPNAIDGRPETAWRCDGEGERQTLVIEFANQRRLSWIGIIPGYAKTDAHDGTDRYAQDRRISAVSYTFDDGTSVTQALDTNPANRSMQYVDVGSEVTRRVVVTVLGSVAGQAVNGQSAINKVAISEIDFR